MRHASPLLTALLLASCGPGLDDNFGVEEDRGDPACENLQTTYCMLPFPSDRYVEHRDDGTTRLAFDAEALPVNRVGETFDLTAFQGLDGFGVSSPAIFHLPDAAWPSTEHVFDPEPSMGPNALTVMINADTGERIPHWLEPDYLVPDEPYLFVLRPAVPLPRSSRIVVGIRGLLDVDGEVVEAPRSFQALRDMSASRHRGLHDRRDHFDDHIFPVLEQAGLPRDDLQLAWDFTTSSTESATRDLLTMRDLMLEQVGETGPPVTWESVERVDGDPDIAIIADGVAEVPSFILEPNDLGLRILRRDAQGLPLADGVEQVPFRLQIPHSVVAANEPSAVMQYGHGFLGRRAEGNNRWIRTLANEHQFSLIAANMQGMDETVINTWISALADNAGNMPYLADQALQGIVNHLALQRFVVGGLPLDPHEDLQRLDEGNAFDPERIWYYGNSQGGSLGTVIMGVSVDIERGVLGVPGCCYPFLMHRSYVFDGYAEIFATMYPEHGERSLVVGLVGTGWDRFDPITFAPHISHAPLPNTPPHQVLLHIAMEDGQVLNEVSHVLARAVGAPLLTPKVREIWGLEEVATPYDGLSATTEYDFGIEPHDDPLVPRPSEPDSHGWLRRQPEGRDQMMHFLRTGEFIHTCGEGPCVFEGRPD
ncbi:MAG: hypothetical protein EA397_04435 [Deltaproteobacteria bacterium]|nr:MAG: hypothetical protein EA397_04435 [Deltaproteobacteria bacterium]